MQSAEEGTSYWHPATLRGGSDEEQGADAGLVRPLWFVGWHTSFSPSPARRELLKSIAAASGRRVGGRHDNIGTARGHSRSRSSGEFETWYSGLDADEYADRPATQYRCPRIEGFCSRTSAGSIARPRYAHHADSGEFCNNVLHSLLPRPENLLQQLRRPGRWIFADALLLFGDHLEQPVARLLRHVTVHIQRGGVDVEFSQE